MDRHEMPGVSAEETARAHAADLEIADRFGVRFFSYWHDPDRGQVFCFAKAPGADAVAKVHEQSHGAVPGEIIEVSESDVVRFLGRVQDPAETGVATSAFRTIGFTDLVGSTELLDRLGQSEYMVLLTEHDLILRRSLLEWKGKEVKHTGDGLMVVFDDVGRALGWSLDVQAAFGEHPVLDVRMGLAAGQPVDHDDDIFGAVVTTAQRICDSAEPEQVYVSQVVRDLGVEEKFEFDPGRIVALKGFSEPATLFELLGTS